MRKLVRYASISIFGSGCVCPERVIHPAMCANCVEEVHGADFILVPLPSGHK